MATICFCCEDTIKENSFSYLLQCLHTYCPACHADLLEAKELRCVCGEPAGTPSEQSLTSVAPLQPIDEQLVEMRAQNLWDVLNDRRRILAFRRDISQTVQNALEFNPEGDKVIKKKVLDFIDAARAILDTLERVLTQINRILMMNEEMAEATFPNILASSANLIVRCDLFDSSELDKMEKYVCFSVFPNRATITRFRHGEPPAPPAGSNGLLNIVLTKCEKVIIQPGHLVVTPLPEGGFAIAYPQHIYLQRGNDDLVRTIRVPFIITDMVVSKIGLIYVIANNCLYHINKHDQIGHFKDIIQPISLSMSSNDKLYVLSADGSLTYIAKDNDHVHPRHLKFSTRSYNITKIAYLEGNHMLACNKVGNSLAPLVTDLMHSTPRNGANHLRCDNRFVGTKLAAIAASPNLVVGIDTSGTEPKLYIWHWIDERLIRVNAEILSVDSDMNEFYIDLFGVKPLLGMFDEIYLVDHNAIYTLK